ncbi:MAG: RnfABCDGE type electron transport complex subunit A [Ruminococcaceae bacterium]|nr:RnfABCDGE type electron transport complex subunit A [Oscillospiraceae bacterium]
MLKNLVYIILTSVLVNNYVLTKFLGICPFLGVSKKVGQAAGMGVAVTFVMLLATAVTHPIYYFLLSRFELEYLQTIVFIVVIASLVQLVEIILKKYIPSLHKSLGIYLPLITTNCAVLGVCANNISDGYSFIEAIASSLGCGLGFLFAMLLFAGVRSKVENANPPKCFRGVPITLVSAAIVALSFSGFAGIVETLFA